MRPFNSNGNNFKQNTMNYLDRADEMYEEKRDEAWMNIEIINLDKYKANLTVTRERVAGNDYIYVFSYDTLVASGKEGGALVQSQRYSLTTSKHVNYVARELNMGLVNLY